MRTCLAVFCILLISGNTCQGHTCFGFSPDDPSVCSGHGICVAQDTCQCAGGWTGYDCSIASCDDIGSCINGTCIAPNVCACEAGWTGTKCDIPDCSGMNDCSEHGACTLPNFCECDPGWFGDSCNTSEDTDGDGIPDMSDNCKLIPNSDQADTDDDGIGNACDPCIGDLDDDGWLSPNDLSALVSNLLPYASNHYWVRCPTDSDGDGIDDSADNCPDTLNPDQADSDADGVGDACDSDEPVGIVWVFIDDAGVSGHEGFTAYMSKYETTNAQYCQFLNAALASGDITTSGYYVYGASGSNGGADFVGETYYDLCGSGYTYDGATDGGAARIHYSSGSFNVDGGFENHPVTHVSWYGATAFCSYSGYRLPTEWEWQAVADYDGSFYYGCGPNISNDIANYHGSTHPHGTTIVGAFGVYGYEMADMAGNVWEWTSSCYLSDCASPRRVVRGGGWDGGNAYCPVSYRLNFPNPYYTHYNIGFRACR